MKHDANSTTNRLALAALAGSVLLASLGISIATVALPTLARAFSAQVQDVQWVVLAYLLAVTAAIVSAGRLGDLYGSRRVLAAGLALFTLASGACALAPDLRWLVAGRAVQGLGAAILMSLPMSVAKGLVARHRTGSAMGLLGTMSAIGTAMGPSVGGFLIGAQGWRAAFACLAVGGAGLFALTLAAVPKGGRCGPAQERMDWPGNAWLSIMLICLALAATGGKAGMGIPLWGLLGGASAALAAFIYVELAATSPLVPVAMLRGGSLSTSLAANLLVGAIMMSTLVVGPFFLSFAMGLSEASTGMVMAAGPIAAALSGVPAGRITDRFGPDRTLVAGLALATVGLCCFAALAPRFGAAGYLVALVLTTPGFQLFLAANNTAVMLEATDRHKGMVSGLLGLSRNLGFMAGASLLPLLFASLLGDQGVAGSPVAHISRAFSATFFCTAGLCVLAIGLAWAGTAARRSLPSPSSPSFQQPSIH